MSINFRKIFSVLFLILGYHSYFLHFLIFCRIVVRNQPLIYVVQLDLPDLEPLDHTLREELSTLFEGEG
jgi:hypothetical protein